jgi:hypothetical protein
MKKKYKKLPYLDKDRDNLQYKAFLLYFSIFWGMGYSHEESLIKTIIQTSDDKFNAYSGKHPQMMQEWKAVERDKRFCGLVFPRKIEYADKTHRITMGKHAM